MADKIIQGSNLIYLFRFEGDSNDAWKIAYQTDGSTSESRSYDSEATKDGNVLSVGAYEGTHSISALYANKAKAEDKVLDLRNRGIRKQNPERIEVWEINVSDINEDSATGLQGHYSIDRINSVDISGSAEGSATVDIETQIEEGPVSGDVTKTETLKSMIAQIASELNFVQPTLDNTVE